MKRVVWSALIAAGALILGGTVPDALAKNRRVERFELVTPVRSPDADAEGVVKVKQRRRGAKSTFRLKKLTPGATYEVRDADSNELLGTVVANKRGKARLKVRHDAATDPGKTAAGNAGPEAVAVYRSDSDQVVLIGDDADKSVRDALEDFAFGDGFYGTQRGANMSVSMFADDMEHEEVFAFLDVRTDDEGRAFYEFHADTIGDEGLPGGVSGIDALSTRPFDVIDADGDEVLSGDLPELRTFADLEDGEWMFAAPPLGTDAADVAYSAPFTLRIAIDGDALEDVGDFTYVGDDDGIFPGDGDFEFAFLGFGKIDGVNGAISLFGDGVGDCFAVSLTVPDGEDGATVYDYGASTFDGQGALPLGVDTLADLVGRALEIRNGAGDVIVELEIPELTDGEKDLFEDLDGTEIVPGEGPFSVWISDAGTLTKAGDMIAWTIDGGFPGEPFLPEGDVEFGASFFGRYDGVNATVALTSIGDEYDDLVFSMFVPDDSLWGGVFHDYFAFRDADENALPFAVDDVSELSGRAFEIRNGDGDAVIADALPELGSNGGFSPFDFEQGEAIEPGAGPFTIWIADDAGDLKEIAELEEFDFDDIFGAPGNTQPKR